MTLKIEYTPLLQKTKDCKARTIVNVGGSGSSKSWSIAQLMVFKFINEKNKLFVIARKTMPACKRSSYGLIVDLLKEYIYGRKEDGTEVSYYDLCEHNKTDNIIRLGSNDMLFLGLDEPTKIKSIKQGANYIWLEESDEFTYDDYMAFSQQLRKQPGEEINHIYLSFNPIDGNGWIPTQLIGNEGVEVIHSTYKDNPFADKAWVKDLESTINQDENYYRVYALGEWGSLEDLIYSRYGLVDEMPVERQAMAYGLDFGFVSPSALIKIVIADNQYYLQECLYKPKLTNADIIELLSHEERGDVYADRNELQMIEEILRSGYNIYPSEKDVKMGLNLCRRQTLNILKSSTNLIKEIRGYQYKKDKNGNVFEEPVKRNDHLMDAMRYGIYGMTERYGFATAKPGVRKSKHSMRI